MEAGNGGDDADNVEVIEGFARLDVSDAES